ncbi:MAG: pyrimidine/purine nucleoside phosphorylase [Candidatus Magasanikbacteria bacterium]
MKAFTGESVRLLAEGRIVSVRFALPDGRRAANGTILPGRYEFTAEKEGEIRVTRGVLYINDDRVDPTTSPFRAHAGQTLVIQCLLEVATCLCYFG